MTKQAITSGEIQQKLNDLDATVAGLNAEKGKLAFQATSGDPKASERLEEIRQAIAKMDFDRGTLTSAMTEARRLEQEAREEAERQERENRINAATELAIELRAACAKIDALASNYESLLTEIDRLEKAIRIEHQKAGIQETATGGLRSAISDRVAAMFASLRGPTFNREKPMVQVMDHAWRHLPGYVEKFGGGR